MNPTTAREALSAWIAERVAAMLQVPVSSLSPVTPFAELGLSSLKAVELSGDLEAHVGRPLSPTLVYDYPTISEVVSFLTGPSQSAA